MPVDPKKLVTFMQAVEPRAGRPGVKTAPKALPATTRAFLKPGQTPEGLLDLLERGDEVTVEQLGRLLDPKVGYMELDNAAKGFACGNCGYAAEGAVCRNPAVLAPVSAKRGCCNLFWNEEQVVFPPPARE